MMTWIIASASAASVPGRIGMCQSASRAVRVRTGSITTSLAPAFLGLLDKGPVVGVGAERVARPQENVFRVHEALGIDPGRGADRHHIGGARAGVAEGAFGDGSAELVEERVADVQAVNDALRAEIAVGQDRLRAVFGDDRLPARGNGIDRLVPGNPLKLPGALGAHPFKRIEHTLVAVDALLIVVDLDAQAPAGERMIRVAAHRNRLAILDGCQNRAGVRAIMWTCTNYRASGHGVLRFVIQLGFRLQRQEPCWSSRNVRGSFPKLLRPKLGFCLFLAHRSDGLIRPGR